ncbi:substrate-binding periplasmic protein [Colwellia sp. 20A7]|uniref:substrate-binding periplasmic protein n=1 Tax=Colwellia sp. 20A7 TaxID=2689569 RepID=UPI00135952D9|nr:transporter substrate-binding domain-containing protein [Colwellia sp. 20A7]
MKLFIFLFFFPFLSFAETLSVALYVNHDDHLKLSRSYKLNWQLLKLAAESEGITLDAKEDLWLRGLNFIKEKKLDALIGVYYSEERENFSYYSQPLTIDNLYLYSQKPHSLTLKDINKHQDIVGVTTKSFAEQIAQEIGFTNIYHKSSSEKVFDLLIKGRLQYAIFTESLANKHCNLPPPKKLKQNCIYPMKPPLMTKTIHTIYNKTPRVINIAKRLDSAIDKFIDEGKVKILFLSCGYSEKEYKSWLKVRGNWINKDNG